MSETFELAEVELHVEGEAAQRVDLEALTFHHAIADLYQLDLVAIADHDLELDERVGSGIRVVLGGLPEWSLPEISGILWNARLLTLGDSGRTRYALRIVPPAMLFTQRDDHRIFQKLRIPDLVAAVFASSPRMPKVETHLVEPHPEREFVVQYGETDLDFAKRVGADEGISIVHRPVRGGVPLLVDDTSDLPRSGALRVQCTRDVELWNKDGAARIREVEIEREVRTAKVVVGDYDFSNPRYVLAASADATVKARASEAQLEQYVFGVGRFAEDADGATRAKRLLEGRRVGACMVSGEVSHPIAAGEVIELSGHRRASIDGHYLVVESQASIRRGATYSASIRAIPLSMPYRPPRMPEVKIAGTQTATVVGAPGETVDVDAEGRIEVAFHWDRRRPTGPGASRRVRVAQSWGGAGHGMFTVPRVGDEVVVAFVDGNPNEPLVVGQVHNVVRPSPLSFPDSKTQAVWRSQSIGADGSVVGYNHVLMEDRAGAERLELRAQRDFVVRTQRSETVTVGASSSRQVGGSESVTVGGARDVTVGKSCSQVVAGDDSLTVHGERTAMCMEGEYTEVAKRAEHRAHDMQFVVTNDFNVDAGTITLHANVRTDETEYAHHVTANDFHVVSRDAISMSGLKMHILAAESFALMVGAYALFLDAGGITLSGPGSSIALAAEGVSIVSAGVVDIKGAVIKLNS